MRPLGGHGRLYSKRRAATHAGGRRAAGRANPWTGSGAGATKPRMILSCPACGTRYLVDPVALGGQGRRVRCARCGHSWHEVPPGDLPRRVDLDSTTEIPRPMAAAARPSAGREAPPATNRVGWTLLVLIVLVVGAGLVLGRNQLVAAWPPAAKLYEMARLPLDASGVGLKIEARQRQRSEAGVPVLVVEGEIVNVSESPRIVPRVRVSLRDENGRELDVRRVAAAKLRLTPSQRTEFHLRIEEPPPAARRVTVGFEVGE